jgi:hypothetical protein
VDATTWFASDTNRTITWTGTTGVKNDASFPKVIVEYSVDGGLYTGNTILDNYQFTASPQNATWATLPDIKSKNVKVKVTFKDYTDRNIESGAFDIFPILQVNAPTLDQQFSVGQTYNNLIKWTQTQGSGVTSVNVYYSTDDGGTWVPTAIATDVAVANGTAGINWTIPNAVGSLVKIKVQDAQAGFEAVNAVSSKFTIRGGVTFGAPQGGVNQTADTALNISWTYTGTMPQFDIYYSVVSGTKTFPTDYVLIADNILAATYCSSGSCTYNWVPDAVNDGRVLNTANFVIDNTLATGSLLYASSTGTDFKRGALVNNLLPANGQVIMAGSTNTDITWTRVKGLSSSTQMKIEYTNNASAGTPTWNTIVASTDNDELYTWPLVPGEIADLGNDVRLRITQVSPDNPAVQVLGDYTSPVAIKGVLTMTAPVGTDEWGAGTAHDVKFVKTGKLTGVKIYYSALGTFADEVQINTGVEDISGTAEGVEHVWSWDIPANTTLTVGKAG